MIRAAAKIRALAQVNPLVTIGPSGARWRGVRHQVKKSENVLKLILAERAEPVSAYGTRWNSYRDAKADPCHILVAKQILFAPLQSLQIIGGQGDLHIFLTDGASSSGDVAECAQILASGGALLFGANPEFR